MTAELGDERAFKDALRTVAGEFGRDEVQRAVEEAVEIANQRFSEAAQDPPEGASLDEWHLEPIIDSVQVYWESGASEGKLEQGDALIAEWTHPHTNKMEVGVEPHEIEGSPYLRWIDRDTGEEIFRRKVQHPGNPGIGAIREGFTEVLQRYFA